MNIRDLPVGEAVIMSGFASAPFAYRLEAVVVLSAYTIIVNMTFVAYALLRTAVAACRRKRAPDEPLLPAGTHGAEEAACVNNGGGDAHVVAHVVAVPPAPAS